MLVHLPAPARSLIEALRLHVQRGIQPLTVVVDDAGGVSVTPPMIQVVNGPGLVLRAGAGRLPETLKKAGARRLR